MPVVIAMKALISMTLRSVGKSIRAQLQAKNKVVQDEFVV